mmetsp:Transcript_21194/g.47826  ORF Transcript_21194/g.47826 Transcript_21194/m.47826 type:complete len:149 (-) Transcript_21194:846-1292(-)
MRAGKDDGPAHDHDDAPDESQRSFTYNAERVIGNGSFGIVYAAQVVETGETVAIKKVFQDKRYKNRELQIMKHFRHPNIVALKHAFYTSGDKHDELFLNVVMECGFASREPPCTSGSRVACILRRNLCFWRAVEHSCSDTCPRLSTGS